jgi:hypothetical protein
MMQTPPTEPSNSSPMTVDEARAWAATWRCAGPELDRVRRDELRRVSTDEALANLAPLFAAALELPPRTTSGLVDQQRLLAKVFG